MFGSEIVEILQKAGLILKHMLGVVLLAWRRMARAGLISWGASFILVELVGSLVAHEFSGRELVFTSVVALIFASIAAYGVMLTVLIEELLLGTIATVRVVEGDVESGARALAVASERRAGEAGSGIMRWLGHTSGRRVESVATPASATKSETQADIEATDEFTSTMPRPRVNARPVAADQLPRIGWAIDQVEPVEHTETSAGAATPPVATPPVATPPVATPPVATPSVATLPDEAPPPAAPREPTPTAPSPAITRPLVTSQPLAEGERSIWSRISKTLVGNVHPPIAEEQASDSEAGAGAAEDSTVN